MKNVYKKHGRLYYRRKEGGRDFYFRLPKLDDPSFAEAYTRAARPNDARPVATRGTLAALVEAYCASPECKAIPADATRTNYARYLSLVAETHGHRSVVGVRPVHVYKMRDDLAETPGKANNYLSVFRTLMSFATSRDWRSGNPAAGVKASALGEHEPRPAEVLEKALAATTPMLRLALVTGLCSGQRIGDVIRMQHGWHDGEIMELIQGKTARRWQ